MNKLFSISFIFVLLIMTSSCKKCDPTNSVGGIIIEKAIVRDLFASTTGQRFVNHPNDYPRVLEMSLDGGQTYREIDFTQYSAFALSTTASCSSGYNKEVTLNKEKSTATYTIKVTECSSCKGSTNINNWVLTSKVPDTYTAEFYVIKD